ncbi:MAG: hypothetical protein JOZ94_29745 [Xanthobacteraceae bacterium]|nr:hypothetical protein [Xanthobacteraceae bacterium]
MSDEGRLFHHYHSPIARPQRSMMQDPVTTVQQHDVARAEFYTITELVWICVCREQGGGLLCRHGESPDTRQHFPDVDEPDVRKLRLYLADHELARTSEANVDPRACEMRQLALEIAERRRASWRRSRRLAASLSIVCAV